MPKAVVTGGAGFIGSHIADALLAQSWDVVVIDNLSVGKKDNVPAGARLAPFDVASSSASACIQSERPDIVFHLAAQKNVHQSLRDPLFDAQQNIVGSLNIIQACRDAGVQRFIFSSTGGAIYDQEQLPATEETRELPLSPYGIAKLSVDYYLDFFHRQFGFSYVSLRYANVYGPRQDAAGEAGVVAIFVDAALRNAPITVNGGSQTRDFVYVDDVVNANMCFLHSQDTGIYNVGTRKETSIDSLATLVQQAVGVNLTITHSAYVQGEMMRSALDASKLMRSKQWLPQIGIEEGIARTVSYLRK